MCNKIAIEPQMTHSNTRRSYAQVLQTVKPLRHVTYDRKPSSQNKRERPFGDHLTALTQSPLIAFLCHSQLQEKPENSRNISLVSVAQSFS